MNALTAVAATAYAIALWMFAPESVWRREVKQAKRNQQNWLTPTPETQPQNVYINWTTARLRDEAKKRKLNWRPLVNGKRTPLKKPDLIALLTT